MLNSAIARASRAASWLSLLLRFAVYGEHPKRAEIAAAYLRLRIRLAFSKRPPRQIKLLGSEIHFVNARSFAFSFLELFVQESYRGCERDPARIIDCGSNIGMSILLFRSLWPSAEITGIEASPETFALLKENVGGMCGVTIVNKAVSDRHGVVPFFTGPDPLLGSMNAIRGGEKESNVETAPLSEFITGSVDLLKIDIEGSEISALDELESSGKMPLIRQLFVEYHHHLPGETHSLALFLERLERCGFIYDVAATLPREPGQFQDVLIRAKRSYHATA